MLSFLWREKNISLERAGNAKFPFLLKWFKGFVFCSLWYGSICAGFLFLYCPLLPLLILHQNLYRKFTDVIFSAWEIYPAALLECIFGTRIIVSGDIILPKDAALIIMNHRTRLDWNFLWAAMFHACYPLAHKLKIVLKASIRHIPGPGWVMQMACFLYIHRRWERDKALLLRTLDYYRSIQSTCQILLFPEGTDLNPGSIEKSNTFAAVHGLESYHYVLHPKTTGFVFLVQKMKQNHQLDAIYDITVGYPQTLPQSEFELARGTFPEEVHFIIKRFPGSSIPNDTDELKTWLSAVWKEKEKTLENFYKEGSFLSKNECTQSQLSYSGDSQVNNEPAVNDYDLSVPKLFNSMMLDTMKPKLFESGLKRPAAYLPEPLHSHVLYLALMFWTLLSFIGLYCILTFAVFQIWAIVNISFFICLSLCSEGLNQLEVSLYQLKEKHLTNEKDRKSN